MQPVAHDCRLTPVMLRRNLMALNTYSATGTAGNKEMALPSR